MPSSTSPGISFAVSALVRCHSVQSAHWYGYWSNHRSIANVTAASHEPYAALRMHAPFSRAKQRGQNRNPHRRFSLATVPHAGHGLGGTAVGGSIVAPAAFRCRFAPRAHAIPQYSGGGWFACHRRSQVTPQRPQVRVSIWWP